MFVVFFVVRLCLNRQAMLLMSGLGIPDEAFFKLQDRMLVNMADILFDENIALKLIAKVRPRLNNYRSMLILWIAISDFVSIIIIYFVKQK